MSIQVFILDRFDIVAIVDGFDLVEAVETDVGVGRWRVRFDPVNSPAAFDAILKATWLGIEIYDTATGWRYGGKCTQRRRVFAGGREPREVELRGVDMMDYLESGLEWPDSGDFSRWWVTSVGSQVLSTAVTNDMYFERGPGALPERQIDGLNIVTPSPTFGPSKTYTSTGRPQLEAWSAWFKGTPYTLRVRLNRTGGAGAGEILFEVAERAETALLVTPELHDGELEIVETAAAATDIIAMGELTGSVPDPEERVTARATAAEATWLEEHREKFVNRPVSPQAEIDDEVADQLTANGATLAAVAADIVIPHYGTGILIGDYATVSFSPDEGQFLSPITEVKLTGTPAGWTRTASIGTAVPHPNRLIDDRVARLAGTVRRLEGELR